MPDHLPHRPSLLMILGAAWALAGLPGTTQAQLPMAGDSPWLSRVWKVDDGLPNNDVTAVAQAADGAMLFATPNGLARYDGWRMQDKTSLLEGIPRSGIKGLLSTRDGALWVIRKELSRHKDGITTVIDKQDVGSVRGPNAFFEAADGTIWISYENGWIFRVKEGQLHVAAVAIGYSQPQPQPPVYMVAEATDGTIWATGPQTLAKWAGDRFVEVVPLPSGPNALAGAREGGAWIINRGDLLRFTEKQGVTPVTRLTPQPPGYRPFALLEDARHRVWIGSYVGGLYCWEDGKLQTVPISNSDVWSLKEDHEGNIWVGTGGGGVCLVHRRLLELLNEPESPISQTARSMCRDRQGNIWMAMQTGELYTRQAGTWKHLTAPQDWPGPLATCVTADASGNVWIASSQDRLVRWNDGQYHVEPLPAASPGKSRIRAIHASSSRRLWIIRSDVVITGTPGSWEQLPTPGGCGDVTSLVEAGGEALWGGTNKGRLLKLTPTSVTDLTPPGLASNSLRTLLQAQDGALWMGTDGTGICRWKNGRLSVIGPAQGLRHEVVSQMVLDGRDRLWAAGDRGIFLLSMEDLNAVADGAKPTVRCLAFGTDDGIPSMQANSGYHPNTLTDADGRIWFASRSGVVIADPSIPGGNTAPPPVGIEEIEANGTLAWENTPTASQDVHIGPNIQSLRVQVSAKSFTAPDNVLLQHRLSGVDTDWVGTPRDRVAAYQRLGPGNYTFEARAMNNDGVWSRQSAVMSVIIVPALWERTWVQILAGIVAAAMLALVVNAITTWRIRRQNELLRHEVGLREERARIARDMHDQVGASLTELCMLSDLAQEERNNPAHLDRLARTARKAVADMDEIVWAVNPEHDDLASLLDYIAQQALDQTGPAGLRCRLDIPEADPNRPLTADFRHHTLLIVREAVNNAIKHAQATEIRIQAALGGQSLSLAITDDGRGMSDQPSSAPGNGLKNMTARATALGGTLEVASGTEGGTSIHLELPWPQRPPLT
ncbi:two-component regulator propeller domain-containing protein [Verrucomicrobium sp. BvORR106]|uniref:sensor histidine kinase n=1 Tax=Verrucomicrobium sp. BvORR106 TaxID=1403819 RepID=UPI00056F7B5E|nr:two-component regulator propeller domain-containing protein [Verrucomicrobium sp. BvORR106]